MILGGIIEDRYIRVNNYPDVGTDALIHKAFQIPGGCSINVSKTLHNLGSSNYILSALGDDESGHRIENYLKDNSFRTECIHQLKNATTGYCYNIVDDTGERTFMTYKGCESNFNHDYIPDLIKDEIGVIYVTGYFLLNKKAVNDIITFLQIMKTNGVLIMFDPGALIKNVDKDSLVTVLKLADIVVPNDKELNKIEEFLKISSFPPWWLDGNENRSLIIKKGGKGTTIASFKSDAVVYEEIASSKVDVIDSTGAGDSFAGGVLYGLLNGYSLTKSVEIGSACGAITTTFMEPHGDFTLKDIEVLITKEI